MSMGWGVTLFRTMVGRGDPRSYYTDETVTQMLQVKIKFRLKSFILATI